MLNKLKRFLDNFMNINISKLFRFLNAGIITYLLSIFLVWFLTERGNIYYLYSYFITIIIITFIGFYLSKDYIFRYADNDDNVFVKYAIVRLSIVIFSPFLVKIFTDYLNLHYIYSVTFVTGFIFVLKFFIYDTFVFNKKVVS